MRTEDHYAYAEKMVDGLQISAWKKKAFKLGCIAPDYNRLTYLGKDVRDFSNGHSFRSHGRQIARFFSGRCRNTILWWYCAGRMIHYLGDSFTRPHNAEFGYRSKEHVAYEHVLHEVVRESMREDRWKKAHVHGDPNRWLQRRHRRYLARTRGHREDAYYIHSTLLGFWDWVENHRLPEKVRRRREEDRSRSGHGPDAA